MTNGIEGVDHDYCHCGAMIDVGSVLCYDCQDYEDDNNPDDDPGDAYWGGQ